MQLITALTAFIHMQYTAIAQYNEKIICKPHGMNLIAVKEFRNSMSSSQVHDMYMKKCQWLALIVYRLFPYFQ